MASIKHRVIRKLADALVWQRKRPETLLDILLDSLVQSNSAVAIDAIAAALARNKLPNAHVETLVHCVLSHLSGNEIPKSLLDYFENISDACLHYSQEGEDVVLARILPQDKIGFFVDIGAHHPVRFSNTYALYRKGWRGINVDATPGCMHAFNRLRPEDINIESAISDFETPMTFHMFKEGALNTFDTSLAKEYVDSGWALESTIELRPRTLSSILDQYLPTGKPIDLLSIDVEGKEMEVLKSNDWHSYCPDFIVLEVLSTPFASLKSHDAVVFLADKGYEPVSRLTNSVILQQRA